ncbi:hypothetical protein P3T39_005092 [Kitasatospora sp. GP82]|nr:hypothetical protein [Kitasatospora sp. GP82]
MSGNDTRQVGIHLFDQWTAMWNLNLDLAEKIMAPEFTLRYAQAGADGAHGTRSAAALGPGPGGVAAGDQVTVPSKNGVRPYQQAHPMQRVRRQPVQQGCREDPVARLEPYPLSAQLPLQHGDLMAQGQDLHVLAAGFQPWARVQGRLFPSSAPR